MKNTFCGLLSGWNMAEENLWAWGYENRNFQTWKGKKDCKKKSKQNRTEYPGTVDNYKSYNIYVMVIPEEEERKKEKQYWKQ